MVLSDYRPGSDPDSSPKGGLKAPSSEPILRMLMVRSGSRVLARFARAFEQAGYTLIETLVVMTLLVIVIGAIADGFTNASKTQTDQTARADDQEAARQALDRLRRDIHCASAAIVTERTSWRSDPGLHVQPDRQSEASASPSPQALERDQEASERRAVVHRADQRCDQPLRALPDDRELL